MSLLHAVLGLVVAVSVALVVAWTLALATGDAERLADEFARLLPGWWR